MVRIRRFRFFSFAWLALGFVVALAWGELFTTVLLPQNLDTILDILQPDPVVGYLYQPNASLQERGRGYDVPFEINSVGLRDREIPPRSKSALRIMLIGNSFSVSHGIAIEESFSRAVEDALNRRSDRFTGYENVEVVNASNAGYNSYNYRMGYRRWRSTIDPDVVLVGFVPGREYRCDAEGTQYVVRDGLVLGRFAAGENVTVPRRNPIRRLRKFLAQNSNLYVLLRNYFYYNENMGRLLNRGDGEDSARRSLSPYLTELPPSVDKGWNRAFAHVRDLRDDVRANKDELIIAAIPTIAEVDAQHAATLREQAGISHDGIDVTQPLRRLIEFCTAEEIPLANLGPAVDQAHDAESAYLFDNHWNANGIAAGAEALADRMQELGLPPFAAAAER